MAHPLKGDSGVCYGPRILLERPDLAALIGCICSDWANVEDLLGTLYGNLMGVYLPTTPGAEPALHPVARQIFSEINTIHSRVNLVKKLAAWVIRDEDKKTEMLKVLDEIKNAGKGRNKVAHGIWGICESESDALIYTPDFGHKMIYKKSDFEEILSKIHEAQAKLRRVLYQFYKDRRSKIP